MDGVAEGFGAALGFSAGGVGAAALGAAAFLGLGPDASAAVNLVKAGTDSCGYNKARLVSVAKVSHRLGDKYNNNYTFPV